MRLRLTVLTLLAVAVTAYSFPRSAFQRHYSEAVRRTRMGGELWTPADLDGDVLWFDSQSGLELSGTSVLHWTDRISDVVASNATSFARPNTTTNTINGLEPLRFDDNDFLPYLTPTNMLAANAKSIISVSRAVSSSASFPGMVLSTRINYGGVNNDTGTGDFRGYIYWQTVSDYLYGHTGGGNAISTGVKHLQNQIALSVATKAEGVSSGLVSFYQDGSLFALTTDQTLTDKTERADGYTAIGRQSTQFANMDLADLVVTPYVLSTSDRQKLEGYLAHKWGLAGNLPALHPYKDNPPTK